MTTDAKSSDLVNQETQEQPEKSEQAIRFANLRRSRDEKERQLIEQQEILQKQQEIIEELQAKMQPQETEIEEHRWKKLAVEAAQKAAEETYAKLKDRDFKERIESRYPDYNSVVNETNAAILLEQEPEISEILNEIKDNYKRSELAYKKMKRISEQLNDKKNIQEKINKNQQDAANFYFDTGQGSSYSPASSLDLDNPDSKRKAYEKLKKMQRSL